MKFEIAMQDVILEQILVKKKKKNRSGEHWCYGIPCLDSVGRSWIIQCPQSMSTISDDGKKLKILSNELSGI
jgi:hypothetical protein